MASRKADLIKSLAGNLATALLGVLTSILVARLFEPSARGEIASAIACSIVVFALADLGVSNAVPVWCAREADGPRPTPWTSVLLALGLGTIFLPATYFALLALVPNLSAPGVFFVLATLPFSLGTTYMAVVFQGLGSQGVFNALRLLGNLPYAFALLAAWIFPPLCTVEGVLVGSTIATWIAFVAMLGVVKRLAHPDAPRRETAHELVRFGIKTWAGNLAWSSNTRVLMILAGTMLGNASLGLFAVAISYAQVPFLVAAAVAGVVPGRVGRLQGPEARREATRWVSLGVLLAGLAAGVVAVTSPWVVPAVFGAAYASAAAVAAILSAGYAILGVNAVLSNVLRATGQPFAPTLAEVSGLVLTLALAPTFIRQSPERGPAFALITSALVVLMLLVGYQVQSHRRDGRELEAGEREGRRG